MGRSRVLGLSYVCILVLSVFKTCTGDFSEIKPASQQSYFERVTNLFSDRVDEVQIKDHLYEAQQQFEGITGKVVLEASRQSLQEQADGNGTVVSELCLNHTALFVEALTLRQGWALDAVDAFGKPGSGLRQLELKWFGSFDECTGIRVNLSGLVPGDVAPFETQYCMANTALSPFPNPVSPILQLGTCFPDSCSNEDVLLILDDVIQRVTPNFTLTSVVCHEKNLKYDTSAIVALTVVGLFLVLLILGTCYDITYIQLPQWQAEELKSQVSYNSSYITTSIENGGVSSCEETPLLTKQKSLETRTPGIGGKLLLSFSVYTNGKKILNTKQSSDSLRAVHGVRFISMTWVILGHTYFFATPPISNLMTKLPEALNRWTFDAIDNATVSVDTFFLLSGLLVSYLALKEMKKGEGRLNWFMFYFHRYWRLTPPYILFMMVYITLFQYMGDGPIYPQTSIDPFCKNNFWINMLYLQNIVKADEQCMGWAWYLANDMQFYILSPLIFVPFFFSVVYGAVASAVFLLTTFITAGVISSYYQIPASMSQMFSGSPGGQYFMTKYYIKPWCRMGPYIIGLLAGYILYKTKCKIRMNKIVCLIGWLAAAGTCLAVLYGLDESPTAKPLPNNVAAFYNAISRTAWGAGVAWVVIACATGNGGYVNTLLSWEGLIPLSRLTYCAYLVHPVVMDYYALTQRTAIDMSDINMIYMFFGNLVAAYAVAFVTSLMFEAPMMGLEKVVFNRDKKN